MAVLLDRLLGEPGRPARIVDLLFHLPHGGISRELKGSIARGAGRRDGDAEGQGDGAPAGAAAARQGAVPRPRRGRHRRHPARLLQRPSGAHPGAAAGRLGALRLGQDRDLGRLPPDGPPRPHPRRAPHRRAAGGRGRVRADRGAVDPARRQVRRRGARARAGAARMAGPGLARTEPLPRLRRGAAPASSPGRRRRSFARGRRREPGAAAARL